MKTTRLTYITLLLIGLVSACKQEVITLQPPPTVTPPTPSKGTADFTKFVALGTSYTAGFQAGALFNDGQANSLPAILNKQFETVGANATFKQPDINATLGYNIFITPNPGADGHVLGRMLLQGASPKPTPQPYPLGDLSAVPNPSVNPGFIYTGSKTALNNFAVEAITLGQFLTPATGDWANPNPAIGFSPFYARFASAPGTSKIIGDAVAAQGSFFMFWGGMDDFMLYAAFGGDAKKAPITPAATFATYYGAVVGTMLNSNPNLKGVVGNFPDILKMPHFTSVPYNPIPMDAATASVVMGANGYGGYNAALDGLIGNAAAFGISDALKAEIASRKISFAAGTSNKPVIVDTQMTDLGPYFDGLLGVGAITSPQRAALKPYQRVRQTTSTDILPLATGTVLGTLVNNDATMVIGISVPLADQYVIVPAERDSINNARAAYNTTVAATAAGFSGKLALADVDAAFTLLNNSGVMVMNNVTITPQINPPVGIYSEDGLHPNSRGYAYISTAFITGINTAFNAVIPQTNIAAYSPTALPIP